MGFLHFTKELDLTIQHLLISIMYKKDLVRLGMFPVKVKLLLGKTGTIQDKRYGIKVRTPAEEFAENTYRAKVEACLANNHLRQHIFFLLQAPEQFCLRIFQPFGGVTALVHVHQLLDMRSFLSNIVESAILKIPRSRQGIVPVNDTGI